MHARAQHRISHSTGVKVDKFAFTHDILSWNLAWLMRMGVSWRITTEICYVRLMTSYLEHWRCVIFHTYERTLTYTEGRCTQLLAHMCTLVFSLPHSSCVLCLLRMVYRIIIVLPNSTCPGHETRTSNSRGTAITSLGVELELPSGDANGKFCEITCSHLPQDCTCLTNWSFYLPSVHSLPYHWGHLSFVVLGHKTRWI